MQSQKDFKETVSQLTSNLGTTAMLMLTEVLNSLERGWAASKREFDLTVDRVAEAAKISGNMAAQEVEQAADQIKQTWEVLHEQNKRDLDSFVSELKVRLEKMQELNQETFNLAVDQAKETLDKQWEAVGRVGENQVRLLHRVSEQMAESFKDKWTFFYDQFQRSGQRVERALHAALEELKK